MDMNGCKTGVVGKNLTHSYSPKLHSLLGDKNYQIFDIKEEQLKNFLLQKDYKGLNVTIPYKIEAMQYMDYIDNKALEIGSINTIVNDGILKGYNTDYDGFLYMCKGKVNNKVCAVLGNGGASLAVQHVLKDEGAKKIYVVSRSDNNLISYEKLNSLKDEIEIIVNTTPVGMYPHMLESIIDIKSFKNIQYVFDLVYNPVNTVLVQEARKLNIEAISGLDMLVKQAIVADELMFNRKQNVNVTSLSKEILNEQMNIVLIGLPGSGKSTIARLLSKALNKPYIDIDEEIVKRNNMSINDIFKIDKGITFRKLEKEIVKEISLLHNTIIATGGGAVLDDDNMKLLKANGYIINLQRDLDKIIIDNNRPLLKSKEDLDKLYKERYDIYQNYKDISIDNNTSLEEVIIKIINNL